MYSPKIKEDLIPIIHNSAKRKDKTMTKFVDELLRPQLIREDFKPFCCSCNMQIEADEGQAVAYCDSCQATVFVERRAV